jgi:hypothetical protein
MSNDTLWYYKLTSPHSLRMNASSNDKWICYSPIRAFKRINGTKFLYGVKDSAVIIYRLYDPIIKKSTIYATRAGQDEDFVWQNSLGLVKSEGTKLMRYDEKQKNWTELFDLAGFGIKKITRFAFDEKTKHLVVVDNK